MASWSGEAKSYEALTEPEARLPPNPSSTERKMESSVFTKPGTPRARLWFATIGLVAVVASFAVAMAAYFSAIEWVDHTLEVRSGIDRFLVDLHALETHGRHYLDTGGAAEREAFERVASEQEQTLRRLAQLATDKPSQVRDVELTARDTAALVAGYRSAHRSSGTSSGQAGTLEAELESLAERVAFDATTLQARESKLLGERRMHARRMLMVALGCGTGLGAMAFGLLFAVWAARALREASLRRSAVAAQQRLQTLSELARSLSEVRTTAEVADVVVQTGMSALGADICTLYLADEKATTLELIGECGVAPALLERIRKMSADAPNSVAFRTLASGEPIWAESEADYERYFPTLAHLVVEGRRAKAFWSMPLIVEGRPVGLLGMGYYEPRPFTVEDRSLVDTLSKHCAQSLQRAVRLQSEDEAQRSLTTTLRSIGDAVIATDPRGLVTFMNPVAEALTGWKAAEGRGKPLEEVFHIVAEGTGASVESPVAAVLREGNVVNVSHRTQLRSRSGLSIPIDDSGAPIRNEQGELIGVVLVFRDVSRARAEGARRDFMSEASAALVGSIDLDATLATVARLAVPTLADWCMVDIVAPGAEDTARQVAVAHVDPKKVELARALAARYPRDPDAKNGVLAVIRSGKPELYPELPPEVVAARVEDEEHRRLLAEVGLHSALIVPLTARGQTFGALTFFYAESKRRYGEDDLSFAQDFARLAAVAVESALALREVQSARVQEQRLRADAEVASRAKDEFLAMVSHELRTPLNAILGWAVMLRNPDASENLQRGLSVIERNARAQAQLIEDVLDVSRIISGKLALDFGPVILGDIVAASIETVTPAAQAKGITIDATLPPAQITITADAQRLQQVVWNLLSNAVKFTPKGGHVRLTADVDGSDARIEVSDSGEGIRPEALEHVFELFQQGDTTTTRRHGGLGLGLAIVKQLVVVHGGTVQAASAGPGQGATFTVRLPPRVAALTMSSPTRPAFPAEGAVPVRLDGLRLLVVDDEEDALTVVTRVLSARGAEVVGAGSAKEAFAKFASLRPDVVVSDIGMPEEDGYTLIRKIRALPAERGGRTPAVALTAYARAEDAYRAFAAGFQLHVPKPIEPAQLAHIVANLGGRSLEPS
jgi:PAS domain S-box-containing protein